MNQRGFAPIFIILGIVLLLSISAGAYFLNKNSNTAVENNPVITPTPTKVDETVNWKTYTNTKYGFEFKHPDNLNVLDITNELVATGATASGGGDKKLKDFYKERYNKDVSILLTLIDPTDSSFSSVVPKKVTSMWISGLRLEISPISKTLVQQTEEFVSDLKTFNRNDPDFKIEQSEMQVNNIRVNKITTKHNYFGAGVRNFSTAFLIKNNNLFTLTNESPGTGDQNKYFDQILSTFKFLDSNTGSVKYTCPPNGYQNCMPILDAEGQKQCSKEALEWKTANCPNFSGAAY